MFVVTFYSFKGGVGRSMALANVSYEFARRGKRVLMVDFDLEAPGLDTYPEFEIQGGKGVVDFVHAYIEVGKAPDVADYVYRCPTTTDGELWVMPAGTTSDAYGERLAAIDWQNLYAHHDGYLLIEDLKAQWRHVVNPDYVLIDSRTGFTDVGGICTRQLPDLVMLMMFPNRQNIDGLQQIVSAIRAEQTKNVDFEVVLSNVPDLDDEAGVLAGILGVAKQKLGIPRFCATVNHYDSLLLLEQEVFTHTKAQSRLARQYIDVARCIARHNVQDRDGVIDYMGDLEQRIMTGAISISEYDRILEKIADARQAHQDDAAVLTSVARVCDGLGELDLTHDLLRAAAKIKPSAEAFLRLARVERELARSDGTDALVAVFASSDAEFIEVRSAVRHLREQAPSRLIHLTSTEAYDHLTLEERASLAQELLWLGCEEICLGVVEDILAIHKSGVSVDGGLNALTLCLIGLGRAQQARQLLETRPNNELTFDFNYAMALWAETKVAPLEDFGSLRERMYSQTRNKSANFWQCLAILCGALGDDEGRNLSLQKARQRLRLARLPEFSAWRYRSCSPGKFEADLAEMAMRELDDWVPPFVTAQQTI